MSSIILCGLTHKSCLQRHRISPMHDVRLQKSFLIDNLSCTDYCTYNNFACTAHSPMQIWHLCNSCQHFYLPVYPDFVWMEDLAYTTFLPIHDLPMQYWARTNWQPIHWLLLYTALCVHGFCLYKNCVNTKTKVLPKVLHLICLETKLQTFLSPIPLIQIHFLFYSNICRLPTLVQAREFFIGLGLLDLRSPKIWTFGLLDFGPRLGRLRNFLLDLDFGPQNLDLVQIFEQVQLMQRSRTFGPPPPCVVLDLLVGAAAL